MWSKWDRFVILKHGAKTGQARGLIVRVTLTSIVKAVHPDASHQSINQPR